MNIVIITGTGSGGLKQHLKAFLQASKILPEVKLTLICPPDKIFDNINLPHITILQMQETKNKLCELVFNKPLPKHVVQRVEKINPDIVFFFNNFIRHGLERYPTLLGMHNQLFINDKQFWRQGVSKTMLSLYLQRYCTLRSMRTADMVCFDSDFSRQEAIENHISFKRGGVALYGINEQERCMSKKEYLIYGVPRLLYVSTIYPYKNQIELVKGIAVLKNRGIKVQLDLIGSGPSTYTKKLQNIIQKYDLQNNVNLYGWMKHADVLKAIDQCDIFVYASSIETSGLGLMEGMARGAVIACNKESCMPEILQDGGVLFNIHSANDVADKIQKLLSSEGLRKQKSHRAYEISKNYTWEKHVKKIYEIFKELLNERNTNFGES